MGKRFGSIGLVFVLAFSLGAAAMAHEPSAETEAATTVVTTAEDATAGEAATDDVMATFGGMQVAIDPETGRLRQPTAEEAQVLAAAMQRMFGARVPLKSGGPIDLGGGLTLLELGAEHMKSSVARITEDGTLATDCVTGDSDEAAKTAETLVAPQPATE